MEPVKADKSFSEASESESEQITGGFAISSYGCGPIIHSSADSILSSGSWH